jgi:broad specificity phosphatase PhoE
VTTTFFLLRHAAHDNVGGFLAGRTPGIRLGEAGRAQAQRLAARISRETLAGVHASPRERTQETARAVADATGIGDIITEPALDEIDFGEEWSGKTFDQLNADPRWRRWNEVRSLARTAGGESMLDVQSRVLLLIERLATRYRNAAAALVTHADVIKALVCHVLGLSTDALVRFDIAPASVSSIAVDDWGARLISLNERVD